jgi:hypothetical protein
MEQKEFTYYIISKIVERFPQFRELCTKKPNDIIDIDYKSNTSKLTFWLTTQDKEITLGFNSDSGCDWHTHMSLFGANTPDEELEVAVDFIDSILGDRKKVIHSSIVGYFPTDNVEDEFMNKEKDEVLEVFKWSDL